MTSQLWWYLARSSGIVAWALVAASVAVGLFLSTKILGSRPRPAWLLDLHRYLGGLALTFTGIHLVSLVLDSYVHFGLVRSRAPHQHLPAPAVAWGIVGFYFLLAVELTSLARKRLSKRVWRATHLLSFPLFALSTVHGRWPGPTAPAAPCSPPWPARRCWWRVLTVASIDAHRTRGHPQDPAVARLIPVPVPVAAVPVRPIPPQQPQRATLSPSPKNKASRRRR